jgi:small subunit ribosomal protein S18
MKRKPTRRIIVKPVNEKCPYCESGTVPDYKEYEEFAKYLSDRGKIYSATRSGFCSKHQRKLSIAIKRARHLALLPYLGTL